MSKDISLYNIYIDLSGSMEGKGKNVILTNLRELIEHLKQKQTNDMNIQIKLGIYGFNTNVYELLPEYDIQNADAPSAASFSIKKGNGKYPVSSLKACYHHMVDLYEKMLLSGRTFVKSYVFIFTDGMIPDKIEANQVYSGKLSIPLLENAHKYIFLSGISEYTWENKEEDFSCFSQNIHDVTDLSKGLLYDI